MKIRVLLFAGIRDRLGREEVELELDPGSTAADVLTALGRAYPEVEGPLRHCRVAVDQAFVGAAHRIDAPAEIAVIPPVSGGHDGPEPAAPPRYHLGDTPLDASAVIAAVTHKHAGGITSFIGNVRKASMGKSIDHLEYEAYGAMAVAAMEQIGAQIEADVPGSRVAIHHRVGRLEVGETAVVIAASAPHRAEAFTACRAAIEALKRDVPIWKREVADDGETWYGRGP